MPRSDQRLERIILSGEKLGTISDDNLTKLIEFLRVLGIKYETVSAAAEDVGISRDDFDASTQPPTIITRSWNYLTGHGRFQDVVTRVHSGRRVSPEDRQTYDGLYDWHKEIFYDDVNLSRIGLERALEQGFLTTLKGMGECCIAVVADAVQESYQQDEIE